MKKILLYICIGLSVAIALASIIAYVVLKVEKPWMAFYFACCGGVLVLNLLIISFFIHKNFKK
jgi:hypothetical protein